MTRAGFETHVCTLMLDGMARKWNVTDLWESARGLPVRSMRPDDIPEWGNLMEIEVGECWGSRDNTGKPTRGFPFRKLVGDVKRIIEADLGCPILLGPNGRILDGIHRLVKAHVLGVTILVQQFEEWP
jgi:hypothetical protein